MLTKENYFTCQHVIDTYKKHQISDAGCTGCYPPISTKYKYSVVKQKCIDSVSLSKFNHFCAIINIDTITTQEITELFQYVLMQLLCINPYIPVKGLYMCCNTNIILTLLIHPKFDIVETVTLMLKDDRTSSYRNTHFTRIYKKICRGGIIEPRDFTVIYSKDNYLYNLKKKYITIYLTIMHLTKSRDISRLISKMVWNMYHNTFDETFFKMKNI
jgi:hypothetical protein